MFDLEGESDGGQDELQSAEGASGVVDSLSHLGAKCVVKGPVADDARYAKLLSDAFIGCKDPQDFLCPWETGHLNQFFQPESDSLTIQRKP